jgi:uncharacterized membrane protein YciS (DUF1049 family)
VWVVKGFLFLVLLFVLVYFFVSNANQTVDINVLGRTYLDVSIFWVVVVSFLLGFAAAFLLAAIREIRMQQRLRRLRKELNRKEQEIGDLRTLPLRDLERAEAAEGAGGADHGRR